MMTMVMIFLCDFLLLLHYYYYHPWKTWQKNELIFDTLIWVVGRVAAYGPSFMMVYSVENGSVVSYITIGFFIIGVGISVFLSSQRGYTYVKNIFFYPDSTWRRRNTKEQKTS